MKHKKGNKQGFNLAKTFLALLVLFLVASLFVKVLLVYKNSRFDGTNRFTVKVQASENTFFLSFSPLTESASIIKVESNKKENFPLIGVDRSIGCQCEISKNNLSYELGKLLLKNGFSSSGLTVFDISRLFLFSRSLSTSSITEKTISEKTEPLVKKEIEESSFIDSAIAKEGLTIEVLNASDVSGLGNKVANIVSHAGGSVVMVQNADKNQNSSVIYYSEEENYTVKKLAKLFNLKPEKVEKKGLADIKIILGEDVLNYLE